MITYDYIIAGLGASGLMTAYRMSTDPWFDDKKILLLDKDEKSHHDRTWCYWERGVGEWDSILTKSWKNIYFGSNELKRTLCLGDFSYKMLRSGDLYALMWQKIRQKNNMVHVMAEILSWDEKPGEITVMTNDQSYVTKNLLQSIPDTTILNHQTQYPYLKQHFVGWFIKTDTPAFNDTVATFMDFDIAQKGNTRFMYLLPMSADVALIEYTLFSEQLLKKEDYETEIVRYLDQLNIEKYELLEIEQGNIPMTCYPFHRQNTPNVIHIGSAGGWTKASTGYTFANTTRKTSELVQFLKSGQDFTGFASLGRHWFYDLIFLDVLHRKNALGSMVFSGIFRKNKIEDIFDFLDEKSSVLTDMKIILRTKPQWEFTISAFRCIRSLILAK